MRASRERATIAKRLRSSSVARGARSSSRIARVAAKRFAGVPPEISQRDVELAGEIEALRERVAHARSRTHEEVEAIASLRKMLAQRLMQRRSFEAQIARDYRAYYALRHPQPLRDRCAHVGCTSFVQFQRDVLRKGEAILVYDLLPAARFFGSSPRRASASSRSRRKRTLPRWSPPFHRSPVPQRGTLVSLRRFGVYRSETARTRNAIADRLPCAQAGAAPMRGSSHSSASSDRRFGDPLRGAERCALSRAIRGAGDENVGHDGVPHYLIEDASVAYLSSASLLNVLRSAWSAATCRASIRCSPSPIRSIRRAVRLRSCLGAKPRRSVLCRTGSPTPVGAAPDAYYTGDRASLEAVDALNASNRLQSYRYVLFGTHAV